MILIIVVAITFLALPWWLFWPAWGVLTLSYLKAKDSQAAQRIMGLSSEELVRELQKCD